MAKTNNTKKTATKKETKKKKEKFWWLQMPKDFFDGYKMKVLINSENGHEIVVFYIKLLLESMNRKGRLRLSEAKAYTEDQLAAVLSVRKEIVTVGLKELSELGLVQILSDNTLYMPVVPEMTRSRTQEAILKEQQRKAKEQQ